METYKDFGIAPTAYLDGVKRENDFQLVKWYKCDKPVKVIDWNTGKPKMQDKFCCAVARIWWNDHEPGWEFESVGTRFLEDYVDGLSEFVLNWMIEHTPEEVTGDD